MVAVCVTDNDESCCMATTTVALYVRPPISSFAGMTRLGEIVLGMLIPADGEISHWYDNFAANSLERHDDAWPLTKTKT